MSTVTEQPLVCIAYKQITVLTSAVGLDAPEGATMAHVQAESQNVRYRLDGTAPTASVGMPIQADTVGQWLPIEKLNKARFIEETATAKLNIHFFKPLDANSL
jgi:hypothetical protein